MVNNYFIVTAFILRTGLPLFPPPNEVWGNIFSSMCQEFCTWGMGVGGSGIPPCITGGMPACLAAGLQGDLQAHTQGGS